MTVLFIPINLFNYLAGGAANMTILFEDKYIDDIKLNDLDTLLGRKENQRLEFKETIENGDNANREIARDICSFANADGGYIILGAREQNETCIGFCSIDDPEDICQRIRQVALSSIQDRLTGLKVNKLSNSVGNNLVLIYIPSSIDKPHMVIKDGRTEFWKRYETDKKPMTLPEIREDFFKNTDTDKLSMIEKKIESLMQQIQYTQSIKKASPSNPINDTQFNLLDFINPRESIDAEFSEIIGLKRYFRLTVTPTLNDNNMIDPEDTNLIKMIEYPPKQRIGGWSIRPIQPIHFDGEKYFSDNIEYHHLRLYRSGHLEFWTEIDEHFCWRQYHDEFLKSPRLYPLSVTEYPVSFLRFAKELYAYLKTNCFFYWTLEYWNLKGCILLPYHPQAFGFISPDSPPRPFAKDYFKGKSQLMQDFKPDQEAFKLIKEFYYAFGYKKEHIPFFDDEGNFSI